MLRHATSGSGNVLLYNKKVMTLFDPRFIEDRDTDCVMSTSLWFIAQPHYQSCTQPETLIAQLDFRVSANPTHAGYTGRECQALGSRPDFGNTNYLTGLQFIHGLRQ